MVKETRFFRKQADKAERMARSATDVEISQRYLSMAHGYRSQAKVLKAQEKGGEETALTASCRFPRNPHLPARLVVVRKGRFAMKKLASVAFAVALSAGSLNLARADQPGPDWMPAQQVIEQVLKSGYTQVTQLEADDGRWEGEGIKNGQKMDFYADPKTGVITFEKLDD